MSSQGQQAAATSGTLERDEGAGAELVDQGEPGDGDEHRGAPGGDLVEAAEPPAPEVEAAGEAAAICSGAASAIAASRPPRRSGSTRSG